MNMNMNIDEEKRDIETPAKTEAVLDKPVTKYAADYGDPADLAVEPIDPAEEKALLRRLDLNIAPIVMILYLIAFLDRANLGNAYTGGMGKDLHFPTNGLSVATSVFYATYVTFETPSTLLLRTLRPSRFVPGVTIIWGLVVLCTGFAKNYATIIATRLLLGALESALSPCLGLYLTMFYQRDELATRGSYLYMSSALSGLVGGLIATGFLKMNGLRGYAGWQWLYIIEGAITIGIGIVVAFVMPDNFHHSKFLTPRQKHIMAVREAKASEYFHDAGWSWVEVKKAFKDPVVWLACFTQISVDTALYGYATFLVVIINQLGFSPVASQALTAPAYGWAAFTYLVAARISDKKDIRYWIVLPLGCASIVGYAMLLGSKHSVGVSLAGAILAGMGIYVCVGMGITWLNLNIAGYRKRSASSGIQQTIGNIGGIIAGQIYRTHDKPRYVLGNAFSLGCMVCCLIGFTIQYLVWKGRNEKRERMSEDEKVAQDLKGVTGDHHWSFRYKY